MKMNIKTNLLEEYVNFVDSTKKQNKYFKFINFLIAIITVFFYLNINQNSIYRIYSNKYNIIRMRINVIILY